MAQATKDHRPINRSVLIDDSNQQLGTDGNPLIVSTTSGGLSVGTTTLKYVQMSGLDSVKSLPDIPPDAMIATVIPEGAGVRMRKDGSDPTSTVGMPIPVGGGAKLFGSEISSARFIQQTASATLNVEYAK